MPFTVPDELLDTFVAKKALTTAVALAAKSSVPTEIEISDDENEDDPDVIEAAKTVRLANEQLTKARDALRQKKLDAKAAADDAAKAASSSSLGTGGPCGDDDDDDDDEIKRARIALSIAIEAKQKRVEAEVAAKAIAAAATAAKNASDEAADSDEADVIAASVKADAELALALAASSAARLEVERRQAQRAAAVAAATEAARTENLNGYSGGANITPSGDLHRALELAEFLCHSNMGFATAVIGHDITRDASNDFLSQKQAISAKLESALYVSGKINNGSVLKIFDTACRFFSQRDDFQDSLPLLICVGAMLLALSPSLTRSTAFHAERIEEKAGGLFSMSQRHAIINAIKSIPDNTGVETVKKVIQSAIRTNARDAVSAMDGPVGGNSDNAGSALLSPQ